MPSSLSAQVIISILIIHVFNQLVVDGMGSRVEPKFNYVEREMDFVISRRLRTRDCIKYINRRLFLASCQLQQLKYRVLRDVYYMICRVRDNRPARTVAEAFTFMLTVKRYERVMELGRRIYSIRTKIQKFLRYMIDENLWHVSPDGIQSVYNEDSYTIVQLYNGSGYQNNLRARLRNL